MNSAKILIVSHDAGGAYLLSKWCGDWLKYHSFRYHLLGPAIKIFKEHIPHLDNYKKIPWGDIDCVITTSGWQTSFERDAVRQAKLRGLYVITYLDHWANYKIRFKDENDYQYPNELWLADREAMNIAVKTFALEQIFCRYMRNRHFYQIKNDVEGGNRTKEAILVCLEPIRNGYSWEKAYKNLKYYLLDNYPKDHKLLIRDHPSKSNTHLSELYLSIKDYFHVEISENELSTDIAYSKSIFSYQSSVLAYACYLNIPAYSFFPKQEMEPILPHKEIIYI